MAPLQVQGPKSKNLMSDLVGKDILDMKYYWWTKAEIRGVPVVITRTGWTSEVGYEIYLLDPTKGTVIWEALMEVGKPYNVKPTGPSDIRRIEGGILNWGADMTYENNAVELGFERLVDFNLPGRRLHLDRRAEEDQGAGGQAAARRRRDRRRALPGAQQREVAGAPRERRRADRQGDLGDLLAAPQAEHRLLLGADRNGQERHEGQGRHRVGSADRAVAPMPFIDPDKRIPVS